MPQLPQNTVICEVLTENLIFDSDILSYYQDRVKKSDKLVAAAFKGIFPLWWNIRTNKKHFCSQCSQCENTFVAFEFNLHKCVLEGQVAKIDIEKPAPVKRAFMPKIQRKSVSPNSISSLSDAPPRRKLVTDAKFVKTNYTSNLLLKRKSEAKNGNSSKRMKKTSSRNENASGDHLVSASSQIKFFNLLNQDVNESDKMLGENGDQFENTFE